MLSLHANPERATSSQKSSTGSANSNANQSASGASDTEGEQVGGAERAAATARPSACPKRSGYTLSNDKRDGGCAQDECEGYVCRCGVRGVCLNVSTGRRVSHPVCVDDHNVAHTQTRCKTDCLSTMMGMGGCTDVGMCVSGCMCVWAYVDVWMCAHSCRWSSVGQGCACVGVYVWG